MPTPRALALELGQGGAPGGLSTDPGDTNADLRWPASLEVYDQMRRADPGLSGALGAIKAPILAADWTVTRTGVRAEVADFIERELGLARDDEGRYRPRPGGVRWRDALTHALLCLDFGHMPMELVAALGPHDVDGLTGPAVHLRKLLPLMPRTLASVDVAADGGLTGVTQYQIGTPDRPAAGRPVLIPVHKLVMFTHRREGGDWLGQSVLRPAYKHWLLKDLALRADGIAVDRNAAGMPVVTAPESEADGERKAAEIASRVRAGDDSGVGLKAGWSFTIVGVQGRTADALASARYHGQEASKATLAMFLELGHDGGLGSGNLSDSLLDVFLGAVNATAVELADVFTDYVVRKLVAWNFGPDEPWPALRPSRITRSDATALESIVKLAGAGLLGPIDDQLVDALRRRAALPAAPAVAAPEPAPGATAPDEVPPTPTPGPVPRALTEPLYGPAGLRRPADPPAAVGPGQVVAASALPPGYVDETARIKERRATAEARAPHAFRPAKWTHPNGHPRCSLCGDEEPVGGRCPGADHDGLSAAPSTVSDLAARLAAMTDQLAALAAGGRTP